MNIITVEKNYGVLNTNWFNFKVTYENGTVTYVPNNEANRDYQEIQQWIADGGTVVDNPPE